MREYEKQGLTRKEYSDIHLWLLKNKPKSNTCLHCGAEKKIIANALIRGMKYEKNADNFIKLCTSCHIIYDGGGMVTSETKGLVSLFKKLKKNYRHGDVCVVANALRMPDWKVRQYIISLRISNVDLAKSILSIYEPTIKERIAINRRVYASLAREEKKSRLQDEEWQAYLRRKNAA